MIEYIFRFIMYMFLGLCLEMIYSVTGIENSLGCKVPRRVPRKYLEGFVSLYMIPLHGFGLLIGFEIVHSYIIDLHIALRFIIWAALITMMEVLWGVFLFKTIKFYPWDYYRDSRYKVFKNGYTLWTLIPQWGFIGIVLEVYSSLMIYLSPYASNFLTTYLK
jgi:hypothetical protein